MSRYNAYKTYARFLIELREFLREKVTLEEAKATVREVMTQRDENFLRLVERGIYGYAQSPYLSLLKIAQVEFGDIKKMVRVSGVDSTLHALHESGVYVTFEEFKGRKPIERNGQVVSAKVRDFDNPYLTSHYYAETGGSTGVGKQIAHNLNHQRILSKHLMLGREVHGTLGIPNGVWRGILPDGSGISNVLRSAYLGDVPLKWFSPNNVQDIGLRGINYHFGTYSFVVMGRLLGVPIPWPETVRLDEATIVAHWMAETLQSDGACVMHVATSRALRICIAAYEEGLDLTGAVFRLGGEPITDAKVRGIRRTGARYYPTYGLSETGRFALGCGNPIGNNDLHLLPGIVSINQYPRKVNGLEKTVPAFNVSTLLPTAPMILFNTEIDDYGVIETRSCGCPLEEFGLTVHIRDVMSFGKLTGEGVTLVGSDMIYVLEEVLPAHFGGSALDYQLLEDEDEDGFTRLWLIVSPRIEIDDEVKIMEVMKDALSKQGAGGIIQLWDQAGTIRIKREEPIWTSRGKFMPIHVVHRIKSSSDNVKD